MTRPSDPNGDPREHGERDHAKRTQREAQARGRAGELERQSPSDDLERLAHREFTRLPLPRAPHTLLPRVMQAVEARRQRAWYARAWFTWPWWAQAASLAAVAILAYGLWRLPVAMPAAPASITASVGTARVIWETLIQPLIPYLAAVMVLMALACVVFGAALNYVLLERVEQRR